MTDVQPGWYKDPADPTTQRYWDGEGWLGDPIPADAPAPPSPPSPSPPPAAPGSVPPGSVAPAVGATSPGIPAAPSTPPAPPPWPGGPPVWPGPPGPPGVPGVPGVPVDQLPPGTPLPPGAELPGARVLPPGAFPPGYPPGPAPPGNVPPGAFPVAWMIPARPVLVTPHGHAIAPLGARLVARLIDIGAVLLLNVVVNGWFAYQWWHVISPYARTVLDNTAANRPTNDIPVPERAGTLELIMLLLAVALWIAYEVPAIANTGQTLGKRLMHVRVLGIDTGKPVGLGRALRRWIPLGASMTLWTCYIGFIVQFLVCLSPVLDRPLRRAWHDRSAGTLVVRAEPDAQPQPTQLASTPEDGTAS